MSTICPQPSLAAAKALLESAQLPTADLTEAHCQHWFSFFQHLGYSNLPRDAAPPAIKTTREFAGICPASSAFMSKQL